jgi:hypothetical protein
MDGVRAKEELKSLIPTQPRQRQGEKRKLDLKMLV